MFLYRPGWARTATSRVLFVAVFVLSVVLCGVVTPALPAAAVDKQDITTASSSHVIEQTAFTGPGASVVYSAPDQAGSGSENHMISLTEFSPTVVRPDDTVRVSLNVTNTTSQTIEDATVTFNLTRLRFSTRSGLSTWDSREVGDPAGSTLVSETLKKPLKPGKSASFSFRVDASELALLSGVEGWGPRGVTFELRGSTESPAELFDALNTYLLWYPAEDDVDSNLNVATIVPITGESADPLNPFASRDSLLAGTGKQTQLSKILSSVEGADTVSLAVDPAAIQSLHDAAYGFDQQETDLEGDSAGTDAEASPTEPAPDDSTEQSVSYEQQTARDWLARFTASAKTHELLALSSYDVDFSAFADATANVQRPKVENYSALSGLTFADYVSWPLAQTFGSDSAHTAGTSNYPITIAESGVLLNDDSLTYTPSGTFTSKSAEGTKIFDADEGLTALVTDPGTDNSLEARQRLVAELAVISKEQPNKERNIVIAPDRTWEPNGSVANAQFKALAQLPWITTTGLSSMSQNDSADGKAHKLTAASNESPLFNQGQFAQLRESQKAVAKVSKVTPDPRAIERPLQRAFTRLASQAWHSNSTSHQEAVAQYLESATAVVNAIKVVPSSDINLISTGAEIPLTVQNDLDQPVSLMVRLTPNDSRLQAAKTVPLEIPAHSSESVRVPVTAVGSGNVDVTVDILDDSGSYITSPGTFSVRVRADWENVGTGVVLTLLALLLVGGIWRTIRRGRSERRVKALAAEEALALVKAESEERN